MRALCFFVAQVCMCCASLCYAKEKDPSFHVLVLHEKGALHGIHDDDAKFMKKTFQSIGEALERKMTISCCNTCEISMRKIRKWRSRINPEDIVVVYYSGKDAQKKGYKGVWPLTKIGAEKVPLNQLAKEIYSKHARLSLVFGDCYNSILSPRFREKRPFGRPLDRIKLKKIRNEIKYTWSSAKGRLLVCSSKHGNYSRGVICGKLQIGAFTEALLTAITYGTSCVEQDPDTGIRVYDKMIKLGKIPDYIVFHMQNNPFSLKCAQRPFYCSIIEEE